jgi:ATP-dependent exoDNAse (exonuclease V) beta subunit
MQQRPRLTTHEDFTYDELRGRWAVRVPYGENRDMTQSLPEIAWLEAFQAQELQEHARVLYVALTRASESLYLSWTQSPQKNSWAEMIRLDLNVGLHECSSYCYQVEVISGSGVQPTVTQAPQLTQAQPRAPWQEVHPALVQSDKPTSVSDLLDHQPSPKVTTESRIDQPADLGRRLKLSSQGTAVHRLMELLKYPHSTELLQKLIGRWFPGQEIRVAEAVNFVRECTQPNLAEIIANGEVEWGFAMSERGLLIEGQIDLWGRTNLGEAWIIDYKTGHSQLREKAFEQMSLYALALRKSGLLQPTETLQLAAVYPFTREIYVKPEAQPEKLFAMMDAERR